MAARVANSYRVGTMPRAARVSAVIGVVVLFFQLFAIAQQHFGPTRYFAWAPNDYIVQYRIQVTVADRELTAAEIRDRYRYLYATSPGSGDENVLAGTFESPPQQLIDELKQYEETYGRGQHASLTLTYVLDGRAPQKWTYSS